MGDDSGKVGHAMGALRRAIRELPHYVGELASNFLTRIGRKLEDVESEEAKFFDYLKEVSSKILNKAISGELDKIPVEVYVMMALIVLLVGLLIFRKRIISYWNSVEVKKKGTLFDD